MFFSRFCIYSSLKTLLVSLFLVFFLSACSGSQPQELFTGNLLSSSSVVDGDVIGSSVPDDAFTPDDNTVTSSNIGSTTSGSNSTSNNSTNRNSTSPKKAFKVAWNAPLQREDGSNLALSEIAEYRVYYGTKKGNYKHVIVVDGNSTLEVEDSGVARGQYFVAVTTVDSDGRESAYSKEIIVTI